MRLKAEVIRLKELRLKAEGRQKRGRAEGRWLREEEEGLLILKEKTELNIFFAGS